MKRNSFIFYRSFSESLEDLSEKQYAKIFKAIVKFALDGEEPTLSGIEKVVFSLVKPQIEANQRKYENGVKGGRPKKIELDLLLDEFSVEKQLRPSIKDFVEHLEANGVKATESRIEDLIICLDKHYGNDITAKTEEIRRAISRGYKRLECEE